MPEDRMRNNDDLDRNMGGAGQKDQNKYGQKTPSRNVQDDEFTGGKHAGQHGDQGQIKKDYGSEKSGGGQGGQNRQNR